MTSGRKLDKKLLVPGLALLTVFALGAQQPAEAQGRAAQTRSGSSSGGGAAKASSGRMSSTSSGTSGSRATPTARGATSGSSRGAARTRQSTPSSRGKRFSGGGHGHHYGHGRHGLGLYFGYGGYWGYGSGYYYPYYHYPYYWGVPYYVPRRAYREYRLGAFDLNVKPKKAEVYLDGQFIGNAGQYDGFPDHLWLEEGTYELIFYRPGLATERRVLSVYPGVVVDVRLRMAAGESTDPAELSNVEPKDAMAEVKSAYEGQRQAAAAPPASAEMDTRSAPGRVRLSVLPADASVYLDGRLLGSGDELGKLHAGLVVEPGSHFIEVVRPGYATERREFAVDEGAEVELEVLLEAG